MTVEGFNELLEGELTQAVEVKDGRSLHRAVVLLGEHLVGRDQLESRFDRLLGEQAQARQEFREESRRLSADFDKQLAVTERRFEAMDRRFDDLMTASLRHSEDVNRRFEDTNKRFDDVSKRFEDVNKRFDDVNKRFDDANKRFDDVGKRFDDVQKRFQSSQWLMGIGFTVLAALLSLYQVL